ncbi:hypothetical protein V2O64_13535 [Verrucomicrobiaceae bacterium 227]
MSQMLRVLPLALTFALAHPALAQRQAQSTSIVQIHPGMIGLQSGNGLLLTENYMENEMESITAPATLEAAAKALGLKTDKEALTQLRKSLSVSPMRGTDFLQITAHHKDPEQAITIANAVTNAYMTRRNQFEKHRTEEALKALDQELTRQSEVVQKHRQELTKLIQKHGIPNFDGSKNTGSGAPSQKAIKSLETAPQGQKLRTAAALTIPNNPVTAAYQKYLHTLEDADNLRQMYRSKHPKMIEANTRIKEARAQAKQALSQLNLLIEKGLTDHPASKEDVVALSIQQHNYTQAKEDYEQSRDMLREMKVKQQEVRILLKMPKTPITIHERAK